MDAKPSSRMTSNFVFRRICSDQTINNGRMPNVQSARQFKMARVYVQPSTTLSEKQLPGVRGPTSQNTLSGLHWKMTKMKYSDPKKNVEQRSIRSVQMCKGTMAMLSNNRPTQTFKSIVVIRYRSSPAKKSCR